MAGDADKKVPTRAGQSGSERRRTPKVLSFRVTPEQERRIADLADAAGVSPGQLVRTRLLDEPQSKRRRRPSLDTTALARLLSAVGRVGSDIQQALNDRRCGTDASPELAEMVGILEAIRDDLVKALGQRE